MRLGMRVRRGEEAEDKGESPNAQSSGIAISRVSYTHMECLCENETYRKDRQAPEQLVEFLNSGT